MAKAKQCGATTKKGVRCKNPGNPDTAGLLAREDLEFANLWDEAIENAVDAVENVVYHRAVGGDIIAAIFYLKAQRPKFRDRLNINVEQVQNEIDEMMKRFHATPGLLNPVSRMMLKE